GHAVLRGIAGIALPWHRECRGVEPGIERRAVDVGITDYIDPLSVAAAGEIGALDGAEADRCRRSADPLRDTGHGPVVEHPLDNLVSAHEAAGMRKVVG